MHTFCNRVPAGRSTDTSHRSSPQQQRTPSPAGGRPSPTLMHCHGDYYAHCTAIGAIATWSSPGRHHQYRNGVTASMGSQGGTVIEDTSTTRRSMEGVHETTRSSSPSLRWRTTQTGFRRAGGVQERHCICHVARRKDTWAMGMLKYRKPDIDGNRTRPWQQKRT